MIAKKISKFNLKKAVFGFFFGIMIMLTSVFGVFGVTEVSAAPETNEPTQVEAGTDTGVNTGTTNTATTAASSVSCEDSLGSLGWLVCPTTGKISEAVDWLYEKIEDILVINPVKAEDGQPIYEIWKYFRAVTNIVFIIFLLVVIYSQITGYGINNYGLKKSLPKLIVAAILVNLSFIICSLAVDLSNIIGNSLRGLFESIEAATMSGMNLSNGQSHVAMAEMYSAMAGGTALAIGGGVVAFEMGTIWMLIPVVLGAIVSVAAGLITIALRQAVVVLLIMIAPLAMVAYILPNTDKWFKQWKQLLYRMLVFYPMFSLLFGASSLAGWAIIVNSRDGFSLLLGTAVQIFPLFFSWKMMKMSGTFLSTINAGMHRLAAGPLNTNRAWAGSHRDLTRAKNLARADAYTPSLKLRQYLENRRIARGEETARHTTTVKSRGLAYDAKRNYRKGNLDGTLSSRGQRAYGDQARGMEYQRVVARHANNMNKGFGYRAEAGTTDKAILDNLDMRNVVASDLLKAEQARGEMIEFENAKGFHGRMEAAMNAHFDNVNINAGKYKKHFADMQSAQFKEALGRYNDISKIMEGEVDYTHFAAASAAAAYDTQNKIIMTKFQKYFEMTPPTKDLEYRIKELSLNPNKKATESIDAIIAGLREVNRRGDTDIVKNIMDDVLDGGLELGTHASQALASFLMFDVKDADPTLRRFGKYINLETARMYNTDDRKEAKITFDEYVKGYHEEPNGELMYAKRPMTTLLEGTSFDNVERTAFANLADSLKKVYTDPETGKVDQAAYLAKRQEIDTAIAPQFISASLKYLSGSEQLSSAVTSLTGYSRKQKKDESGKVAVDEKGNPIYEWVAEWENESMSDEERAMTEKYFREKTEKYFKDQTPAQILGMRSDYKAAVNEHLTNAWLDDPEHPERRAEYNARVAQIQNKYGNSPIGEARKNRDKELMALKDEMTGKRVRKILADSGKLEQIYRTRRSGAANNAKDWMRYWLNLDNEVAINDYLNQSREEQKRAYQEERKRRSEADPYMEDDDTTSSYYYTEADRNAYMAAIDDLYAECRDDDSEVFFRKSMEEIADWLGEESFIAYKYEKFYEKNKSADAFELREYLRGLLRDPTLYPGGA
ncbi:MAG: MFS transporter [Candidatus Saccharibacteria bacterium]|nr:MFS transporter [Candidatus Saccharibacteria bacterium]